MTQRLLIHPADPLDVAEARRLVEALDALPPGVRVHVDLTGLREVHATGLAALALALDRDGRVTLGGLRRHDERLLAYLLATSPTPAAGPGRPPRASADEAPSETAQEL